MTVLAECSQSDKERPNISWLLEHESNYSLATAMSTTQHSLLDGRISGKEFVPQVSFQLQTRHQFEAIALIKTNFSNCFLHA